MDGLLKAAQEELEAGLLDESIATFAAALNDLHVVVAQNQQHALHYLLLLAQEPGEHFPLSFSTFASWLRGSNAGSKMRSAELARTLALTEELAALPSTFSSEVRSWLAAAIADRGDLTRATTRIESWANIHRANAPDALADLQKFAPRLHDAVGPAFRTGEWAWGRDHPKYNAKIFAVAIAGMLSFALWGSANDPDGNDSGIRPNQAAIMNFHDAIDAVCSSADERACETATEVRRAVGRTECDTARILFTGLVAGAPTADFHELQFRLDDACGPAARPELDQVR